MTIQSTRLSVDDLCKCVDYIYIVPNASAILYAAGLYRQAESQGRAIGVKFLREDVESFKFFSVRTAVVQGTSGTTPAITNYHAYASKRGHIVVGWMGANAPIDLPDYAWKGYLMQESDIECSDNRARELMLAAKHAASLPDFEQYRFALPEVLIVNEEDNCLLAQHCADLSASRTRTHQELVPSALIYMYANDGHSVIDADALKPLGSSLRIDMSQLWEIFNSGCDNLSLILTGFYLEKFPAGSRLRQPLTFKVGSHSTTRFSLAGEPHCLIVLARCPLSTLKVALSHSDLGIVLDSESDGPPPRSWAICRPVSSHPVLVEKSANFLKAELAAMLGSNEVS